MNRDADDGEVKPDEQEFVEEAEVEPGEEAPEPRLRRGLFGFRTTDVRAEIEARNAEAEKLRDDVSALWLVFNQHERAIRELIVAVERLGGGRIPPPGERDWDDADNPGGGNVPEAWIADQMEGLDEVLAAIRQATEVLERSYEEQIEPGAQRPAGAAPPPRPPLPPARPRQPPPPPQQPPPPPDRSGGNAAERL